MPALLSHLLPAIELTPIHQCYCLPAETAVSAARAPLKQVIQQLEGTAGQKVQLLNWQPSLSVTQTALAPVTGSAGGTLPPSAPAGAGTGAGGGGRRLRCSGRGCRPRRVRTGNLRRVHSRGWVLRCTCRVVGSVSSCSLWELNGVSSRRHWTHRRLNRGAGRPTCIRCHRRLRHVVQGLRHCGHPVRHSSLS